MWHVHHTRWGYNVYLSYYDKHIAQCIWNWSMCYRTVEKFAVSELYDTNNIDDITCNHDTDMIPKGTCIIYLFMIFLGK